MTGYLLVTAVRHSVTETDGERMLSAAGGWGVLSVPVTLTAGLADTLPGYLGYEMEVREVHKFSVITRA